MNNYLNILIESAIDKAVNEATYNGYDIPEVNGTVDSSSMVKVYRVLHSEQIESVLKNGYSREFARSTDNSWYGEGVYCTVNFKDTVENAVKNPRYGDSIMEIGLIGGFDRFLVFDKGMALKIYGEADIKKQIYTLLPKNAADEMWNDVINIVKRHGLSNELNFNGVRGRSAGIPQNLFKVNCPLGPKYAEFISKYNIRGVIYKGLNDGLCAVAYDFSAALPLRVAKKINGTWTWLKDPQYNLNWEEYKQRGLAMNDVTFKFGKRFDTISSPIPYNDGNINTGLSVVSKGKTFNMLDTKSGNLLSPIPLEKCSELNPDNDTFQIMVAGQWLNACYYGVLDNDGNPWFGWDDLGEYVNYIKNNQ